MLGELDADTGQRRLLRRAAPHELLEPMVLDLPRGDGSTAAWWASHGGRVAVEG